MKPVFLTGVKHCGKSAIGKLLAEVWGAEFIDIDEVIAEEAGMPPREIFLSQGEAGFQEAELQACRSVRARLSGAAGNVIVAAGGGVCDNVLAADLLRDSGVILFLDVREEVILERIMEKAAILPDGSLGGLPAYIAAENPRTKEDAARVFHPVFERRRDAYTILADAVFAPEDCPAKENAEKLALFLQDVFPDFRVLLA